jgi:hypothetical protein
VHEQVASVKVTVTDDRRADRHVGEGLCQSVELAPQAPTSSGVSSFQLDERLGEPPPMPWDRPVDDRPRAPIPINRRQGSQWRERVVEVREQRPDPSRRASVHRRFAAR